MIKKTSIFSLFSFLFLVCCSDNELQKKGFQVREISQDQSGNKVVGLQLDSLEIETRPRNVLLTKNPVHRLTPIYKINYDAKTKKPFSGSNYFHKTWDDDKNDGNNWNTNFMPGFEAVYGYNFVNVSHHNNESNTAHNFFESPVLIKTLYYPAFSQDSLNYKPVNRKYYMVSVYDEDSNTDGFINSKDLRRFYFFDSIGRGKKALVPKNYSVMSSEYDPANDYMYIFTKLDENGNGQMETNEKMHIFWIDLKNPENTGIQYGSE